MQDADDDGDQVPTRDERPNGRNRDTDGDGTPDHLDSDDDGDAVDTPAELSDGEPIDSDNDGTPDHLDPDDDGDRVASLDEVARDTDGDGIPDRLDPDDDNDLLSTEREVTDAERHGEDLDGDGIPNHRDTDSDGDGHPDRDEPGDTNENEIPDYLEPAARTNSGCTTIPGATQTPATLWLLTTWLLWRRQRTRPPTPERPPRR